MFAAAHLVERPPASLFATNRVGGTAGVVLRAQFKMIAGIGAIRPRGHAQRFAALVAVIHATHVAGRTIGGVIALKQQARRMVALAVRAFARDLTHGETTVIFLGSLATAHGLADPTRHIAAPDDSADPRNVRGGRGRDERVRRDRDRRRSRFNAHRGNDRVRRATLIDATDGRSSRCK